MTETNPSPASRFRDLREVFDNSLTLPVAGKLYRIPGPSARVDLMCKTLLHAGLDVASGRPVNQAALGAIELDDNEENDLYRQVLGPVYQQLVDDGVAPKEVQFVGTTALIWVVYGDEIAERYWESGGHPEAPGPDNRAQRRASTSTAGATTTRTAGSTSGTSSQRSSSRRRGRR